MFKNEIKSRGNVKTVMSDCPKNGQGGYKYQRHHSPYHLE